MTTEKPEALRLADGNEECAKAWLESSDAHKFRMDTAAELRRLHAKVAELEAMLEAVGAGGVGSLMAPASPSLANYDPSIKWAKQTVEITYQSWDYRTTVQIQVGGNCRGHVVMESALSTHADKLFKEQGKYPDLILTNAAGDTLETSFDDDVDGDVESWLADMCVGMRIIKQAKE